MVRTLASAVVIAACMAVSACGAATSPLAPVTQNAPPSVASLPGTLPGVWHGYIKAVECIIPFPCHAEATEPFVLRVASSGAGFVGTLEMESAAGANILVMDVTGAVQADGSVLFTGARLPLDSDRATMELRRLAIRLDTAAGLIGDIDIFRHAGPNDYNHTFIGRVLSASFEPLMPPSGQSVSGTWSGVAVIRTCAGHCPSYQDPGDTVGISLVLGQAGGSLSGTLQLSDGFCSSCPQPVRGSRLSSTLTLTGDLFSTTGGRVRSLESFDGTLDILGRIAGRFTYFEDDANAIVAFHKWARLECEILWLKRD